MQVERPAQRPCLHERAVAPERVADILLGEAIDAGGELQLGGRLHLRVNSADLRATSTKSEERSVSELRTSRRARTASQVREIVRGRSASRR